MSYKVFMASKVIKFFSMVFFLIDSTTGHYDLSGRFDFTDANRSGNDFDSEGLSKYPR